jgi:UDP-N-acetyl-D-mannosaminuronate dehydrogenase
MQATHTMERRPFLKAIEVALQNRAVKSYLVVGIAFKPGQSYCGNSPSLAFANQLRDMGLNVFILDPLVTKSEHTLLSQEEALDKLETGEIEMVVLGMRQWNVDFERLKKYRHISFIE